jgi:CRISPR-associated protein Csh1
VQDRVITEIGRLQLKEKADLQPYQFYVEEISPGNTCTMALIVFEEKDGKIHYKHIDVAKVNEDNYQRYGYRKGTSRGGDITFTTKFFGDTDTKIQTLLNIQLPKFLSICKEISESEYSLFRLVKGEFQEKLVQIQNDLSAFYSGLTKQEQKYCAFSLAIDNENNRFFLADFQSVQKQILTNGTEGKRFKYKVLSKGKNNLCSTCHQKKEELNGFASPFKYATVDKPGTVSGFFNQKNNWINYPICEECALEFELGKNYIGKHLTRSFFGKRYFLIPKTFLPNDKGRLQKALNLFKKLFYEVGGDIERREDYLMEKIGGLDNFFTLDLLFYKEDSKSKAINIKLMLEEIPPSRFRTLFIDAPKAINSHSLYSNADYNFSKKEKVDLKFSFGLINQFFEDNFYDIIYKVFLGQPVNRADLFSRFMQVIRRNYNKKMTSDVFVENLSLTILKAHLVLCYFENLNIVPLQHITVMISEEEKSKKFKNQKKGDTELLEKLKNFLQENTKFIYADHVAGVFSTGVLIRLVLDKQYVELKNTPFEKKLKGLNLSASDIQKIYLEGIDKINQYFSIHKYQELRLFITDNFNRNFSEVRKMTNQEISFYFVSGMELGRKFKPEKELQDQQ